MHASSLHLQVTARTCVYSLHHPPVQPWGLCPQVTRGSLPWTPPVPNRHHDVGHRKQLEMFGPLEPICTLQRHLSRATCSAHPHQPCSRIQLSHQNTSVKNAFRQPVDTVVYMPQWANPKGGVRAMHLAGWTGHHVHTRISRLSKIPYHVLLSSSQRFLRNLGHSRKSL